MSEIPNSAQRISELARLGEVLFHTDDLVNLWKIKERHTLRVLLKRYVDRGILFRVHRGYYALRSIADIDPLLLGLKAVHGYAYVSTETVLAEEGVIAQAIPFITIIGSRTKRFTIDDHAYRVRRLAERFLYNDEGITTDTHGIRRATLSRAVADLLYFNPSAHLDAPQVVDWHRARALAARLGYPLSSRYYA